jgi:hypothetical protein
MMDRMTVVMNRMMYHMVMPSVVHRMVYRVMHLRGGKSGHADK